MAGVSGLDPVTFEVLRHAFVATAAEMKLITTRSAYSVAWREAGDLSCAVLTPSAEVVAQGPDDVPIHLGCMPFSLAGVLRKIPLSSLKPGDIVFNNDPEWGNNHLPDCVMAKPIFVDDEIIAFAAVRGHWIDIGGRGPGSYTTLTREIYEEGIRIPPVKIFQEGVLDQELLDLIVANVRGREERLGDFQAQLAGCLAGERRILALVKKYGRDVVVGGFAAVLEHSEAQTRSELSRMESGTYQFEGFCDGDGVTDRPVRIAVTMTIADGSISFDFTGTDPQAVGGINAPLAVTSSAAYYVVKAATDPANPCNSGNYRPIRISAPEGSLLNPRLPAPVVAGNHETANILVDILFGALNQACRNSPERVIAAGAGSAVVVVIGGTDPRPQRKGRQFIYIEPFGAAWGARYNKDGISGMRVGTGNVANQAVEIVETEYPLRIEQYELVPDRGGAGKFRGGLPVRRVIRLLADVTFTLTAERSRIAPFGFDGGLNGQLAEYLLGGQLLFSKTAPLELKAGDVVSICSAGGGGFGPPRERDSSLIQADLREGYITLDEAVRDYNYRRD